ncbi:MAG: peptidoglycan-binding domain-containing protein [Lachnospiraceae bacterium]|nr:peptidoglycan-binding domain-containing protein [Lachnospiraceae bacterium]
MLKYMQSPDQGKLKISVVKQGSVIPVEDAKISVSYTGEPDRILEGITTDANGQTEILDLEAPPIEYSMEPGENQPYSEYTLQITAEEYEPITISGAEILADVTALQQVQLNSLANTNDNIDTIVIGPHTLYGDYPPKIAEPEIKPVTGSGEIVLSKVVVPEYIVVHNGPVTDSTAADYYERYRDYIKNVAACEIYATWPRATLEANILAIMSFTLNRVYTEWYRNKGYDYTITSSTAFDHKWIRGKNTYDTIDTIVDEIFTNYLSRPNVVQPILTQYCDGRKVSCPQWLTQWGSKSLGDQGYSPIEILRYYYGDSMYINVADEISGIPASWPGADLTIGSTGSKVRQMQEQINRIAKAYPSIPTISADGVYGEQTSEAVRKFQNVFGLPQTGVVDYPTWYKISEIYVGVSRIAELN